MNKIILILFGVVIFGGFAVGADLILDGGKEIIPITADKITIDSGDTEINTLITTYNLDDVSVSKISQEKFSITKPGVIDMEIPLSTINKSDAQIEQERNEIVQKRLIEIAKVQEERRIRSLQADKLKDATVEVVK